MIPKYGLRGVTWNGIGMVSAAEYFLTGWEALATASGALKGLRMYKTTENILHVLLLNIGNRYSLRKTTVRAQHAMFSDLSAVVLMKRLKKSGP